MLFRSKTLVGKCDRIAAAVVMERPGVVEPGRQAAAWKIEDGRLLRDLGKGGEGRFSRRYGRKSPGAALGIDEQADRLERAIQHGIAQAVSPPAQSRRLEGPGGHQRRYIHVVVRRQRIADGYVGKVEMIGDGAGNGIDLIDQQAVDPGSTDSGWRVLQLQASRFPKAFYGQLQRCPAVQSAQLCSELSPTPKRSFLDRKSTRLNSSHIL